MKLNFAIFYANGVPTFSPGLRSSDRYPGRTSPDTIQPQRGCAPNGARPAPIDGTALRFDNLCARSQGRPHCIRPTLGWRTESRWDRNPVALNSHLSYAKGVPSSSPGLRSPDRYPGTTRRGTIQPQRGCAPNGARFSPLAGTALRFMIPRACSQGRPHCIRLTLGWRSESRWDWTHGIRVQFHRLSPD